MESQIKASLISLLDGIKRADGVVIAQEMENLDGYLARGQADRSLHPQLEHFLEKRSYAKAMLFLSETGGGVAEVERPKCAKPGQV